MALILAFAVETAGADPKVLSCILGGFFAMRVAHVYVSPRPFRLFTILHTLLLAHLQPTIQFRQQD